MSDQLLNNLTLWAEMAGNADLEAVLQTARLNHYFVEEMGIEAEFAIDDDVTFGHIELSFGHRVYLEPLWELGGNRVWFATPMLSALMTPSKRGGESARKTTFIARVKLVRDTDAGEDELEVWDVMVSDPSLLIKEIMTHGQLLHGALLEPTLNAHGLARIAAEAAEADAAYGEENPEE